MFVVPNSGGGVEIMESGLARAFRTLRLTGGRTMPSSVVGAQGKCRYTRMGAKREPIYMWIATTSCRRWF